MVIKARVAVFITVGIAATVIAVSLLAAAVIACINRPPKKTKPLESFSSNSAVEASPKGDDTHLMTTDPSPFAENNSIQNPDLSTGHSSLSNTASGIPNSTSDTPNLASDSQKDEGAPNSTADMPDSASGGQRDEGVPNSTSDTPNLASSGQKDESAPNSTSDTPNLASSGQKDESAPNSTSDMPNSASDSQKNEDAPDTEVIVAIKTKILEEIVKLSAAADFLETFNVTNKSGLVKQVAIIFQDSLDKQDTVGNELCRLRNQGKSLILASRDLIDMANTHKQELEGILAKASSASEGQNTAEAFKIAQNTIQQFHKELDVLKRQYKTFVQGVNLSSYKDDGRKMALLTIANKIIARSGTNLDENQKHAIREWASDDNKGIATAKSALPRITPSDIALKLQDIFKQLSELGSIQGLPSEGLAPESLIKEISAKIKNAKSFRAGKPVVEVWNMIKDKLNPDQDRSSVGENSEIIKKLLHDLNLHISLKCDQGLQQTLDELCLILNIDHKNASKQEGLAHINGSSSLTLLALVSEFEDDDLYKREAAEIKQLIKTLQNTTDGESKLKELMKVLIFDDEPGVTTSVYSELRAAYHDREMECLKKEYLEILKNLCKALGQLPDLQTQTDGTRELLQQSADFKKKLIPIARKLEVKRMQNTVPPSHKSVHQDQHGQLYVHMRRLLVIMQGIPTELCNYQNWKVLKNIFNSAKCCIETEKTLRVLTDGKAEALNALQKIQQEYCKLLTLLCNYHQLVYAALPVALPQHVIRVLQNLEKAALYLKTSDSHKTIMSEKIGVALKLAEYLNKLVTYLQSEVTIIETQKKSLQIICNNLTQADNKLPQIPYDECIRIHGIAYEALCMLGRLPLTIREIEARKRLTALTAGLIDCCRSCIQNPPTQNDHTTQSWLVFKDFPELFEGDGNLQQIMKKVLKDKHVEDSAQQLRYYLKQDASILVYGLQKKENPHVQYKLLNPVTGEIETIECRVKLELPFQLPPAIVPFDERVKKEGFKNVLGTARTVLSSKAQGSQTHPLSAMLYLKLEESFDKQTVAADTYTIFHIWCNALGISSKCTIETISKISQKCQDFTSLPKGVEDARQRLEDVTTKYTNLCKDYNLLCLRLNEEISETIIKVGNHVQQEGQILRSAKLSDNCREVLKKRTEILFFLQPLVTIGDQAIQHSYRRKEYVQTLMLNLHQNNDDNQAVLKAINEQELCSAGIVALRNLEIIQYEDGEKISIDLTHTLKQFAERFVQDCSTEIARLERFWLLSTFYQDRTKQEQHALIQWVTDTSVCVHELLKKTPYYVQDTISTLTQLGAKLLITKASQMLCATFASRDESHLHEVHKKISALVELLIFKSSRMISTSTTLKDAFQFAIKSLFLATLRSLANFGSKAIAYTAIQEDSLKDITYDFDKLLDFITHTDAEPTSPGHLFVILMKKIVSLQISCPLRTLIPSSTLTEHVSNTEVLALVQPAGATHQAMEKAHETVETLDKLVQTLQSARSVTITFKHYERAIPRECKQAIEFINSDELITSLMQGVAMLQSKYSMLQMTVTEEYRTVLAVNMRFACDNITTILSEEKIEPENLDVVKSALDILGMYFKAEQDLTACIKNAIARKDELQSHPIPSKHHPAYECLGIQCRSLLALLKRCVTFDHSSYIFVNPDDMKGSYKPLFDQLIELLSGKKDHITVCNFLVQGMSTNAQDKCKLRVKIGINEVKKFLKQDKPILPSERDCSGISPPEKDQNGIQYIINFICQKADMHLRGVGNEVISLLSGHEGSKQNLFLLSMDITHMLALKAIISDALLSHLPSQAMMTAAISVEQHSDVSSRQYRDLR